jgi:hypothetical protein
VIDFSGFFARLEGTVTTGLPLCPAFTTKNCFSENGGNQRFEAPSRGCVNEWKESLLLPYAALSHKRRFRKVDAVQRV